MSRLMHLTALLLSLLVGGQGMTSVGEGWICNATGTPMPGCPCTSAHTDDGGHADEAGFASTACCERIQGPSEAPAPLATATSKQLTFEKVLLPTPVLLAPSKARVVHAREVLTPDASGATGRPVYLQLRRLLI